MDGFESKPKQAKLKGFELFLYNYKLHLTKYNSDEYVAFLNCALKVAFTKYAL